MLLDLAARRRLLVVGGKGGVGKTSIASAVALDQARRGRRVLLVSTDPAHSLGHVWEQPVGDDGTDVAPGVRAVEIDPAATTETHLRAVGDRLRRLMPEHLAGEVDRHLEQARGAPGMHEAAVLERVAELVDVGAAEHDLTVLDTAPSGHTARLVGLPEAMTAWTDGLLHRQERSARFDTARTTLGDLDDEGEAVQDRGSRRPGRRARTEEITTVLRRRRDRLNRLRAALTDGHRTSAVVVLTAERLPVLETAELHAQLTGAGLGVGLLVVNRRSPRGSGGLLDRRHDQEDVHLRELVRRLPQVPVEQVPLLAQDVVGVAGLTRLVSLLGPGSGCGADHLARTVRCLLDGHDVRHGDGDVVP